MCWKVEQEYKLCTANPPHKYWESKRCDEWCGQYQQAPFKTISYIVCSICHRIDFTSQSPEENALGVSASPMGWATAPQLALQPQTVAAPASLAWPPPYPPPQVAIPHNGFPSPCFPGEGLLIANGQGPEPAPTFGGTEQINFQSNSEQTPQTIERQDTVNVGGSTLTERNEEVQEDEGAEEGVIAGNVVSSDRGA